MTADSPLSAPPAPKVIVFDVGGVLCVNPVEEFEKVDLEHALPAGTIASFIRGGDVFARCETGHLPITDFYAYCLAEVAHRHGVALDVERLDVMFTACMGSSVRPEMWTLLQELKAGGYRLALLTNIFAERREWLRTTFPPSLIDFYGDSSELGLRKPDPAIYELLLQRLDVSAREVVFVDDFAENLVPARELGVATIQFLDPAQVRRALAAWGVDVSAVATPAGYAPEG